MERMHPQDLRAQLALEFYKMCTDDIRQGAMEWAVESTDMLLAELERTAKAEPEGVWVLESEHKRVMDQLTRYSIARAELPPIPDWAPGNPNWPDHCAGLLIYISKLRDTAAALRVERDEAQRAIWTDKEACARVRVEEQERIIALLDCEADPPAGFPSLLVRNVSSGKTLNAADLRAYLVA